MVDAHDIADRFMQLELEAGFYNLEVENRNVWDLCRLKVYRELCRKLDLMGQSHTQSPSSKSVFFRYKNTFTSALKSAGSRNPYLANHHDILVYGHSRRKRLDDGYWWDLYFDPLYENSELDYLHLEKQYLDSHLTPARTDNLRYMDFIKSLGLIWKKTGLGLSGLSQQERTTIEKIEHEVERAFDVELDIVDGIQHRIRLHEALFRLYRKMLARIDPKIAVLVVSYGREAFIDACKELDIPVIELQHGVIHERHLGYHYPAERTKTLFPDYLLTWGEFWSDSADIPISDECVNSVGYPYLEQQCTEYADVDQKNQILFISQGTIGTELSKLAVEINQHPTIDHDVVYKLHPGEYDRWQDEYPWLVDVDLDVIDGSEPPLYKLFAESSTQIGVGSTAVYEGLCFDLETYVYDLPGASVLEPLVDDGVAELISSVDELVSSLGTRRTTFDREYYFEPNATENVCQTLQQLASDGICLDLE